MKGYIIGGGGGSRKSIYNSLEPTLYTDHDQAPVPSHTKAQIKFAHKIASIPARVLPNAISTAVPALVPFWGGALPEGVGVGVGCVVLVDADAPPLGAGVLLGSGSTLVKVVGRSVDVWIVTTPDSGPPDGRVVVCRVVVPPPPPPEVWVAVPLLNLSFNFR